MKTSLIYGSVITLVGAFCTIIYYLIGWHSDPTKVAMAGWVDFPIRIATLATGLILGARAIRAETPVTEPFSYGSALWASIRISFFSVVTGLIFFYLYVAFINTSFTDVMVQSADLKMQAAGMSQDIIDKREVGMRKFYSPVGQIIFFSIFGMIFNTIISLITSIFCTRPNPDEATAL